MKNTTSISAIHDLYVGLFPWQAIELSAERVATRGLALDPWPKEEDFIHWFTTLLLLLFPMLIFLTLVRVMTWYLHRNRHVQDQCARRCYISSGVVQMIMALTALFITLTCEVMDQDNVLGIRYIHIAEHVAKYGTPAIVATINWCLLVFSLGWIETFSYAGFSVGRSEFNAMVRKTGLAVLGGFIWLQAQGHGTAMAVLQVVAGLLYIMAPYVTRYINLLIDRGNGLRCKPHARGDDGGAKSTETSSELPRRLVENILVGIASLFMSIVTPNVRINYKYLVMDVTNEPFYVLVILGTIWTVCTVVLLVVFSLLDCICTRFRYKQIGLDQYDTASALETNFVAVSEDDLKNLDEHNGIPLRPSLVTGTNGHDSSGEDDDANLAAGKEKSLQKQERAQDSDSEGCSESGDENVQDQGQGRDTGNGNGDTRDQRRTKDGYSTTSGDHDIDGDVEKGLDREDETEGDGDGDEYLDLSEDEQAEQEQLDGKHQSSSVMAIASQELARGLQVAINMDTSVSASTVSKDKADSVASTVDGKSTSIRGKTSKSGKVKKNTRSKRVKARSGRKKQFGSIILGHKQVALGARDAQVNAIHSQVQPSGLATESKVSQSRALDKQAREQEKVGDQEKEPMPTQEITPVPPSTIQETATEQALQSVLHSTFQPNIPPSQPINVAPEQTLEFFSRTSTPRQNPLPMPMPVIAAEIETVPLVRESDSTIHITITPPGDGSAPV